MKIRKILAALSAITMTITASDGYFPAKQVMNARAEDSIQSVTMDLPAVM